MNVRYRKSERVKNTKIILVMSAADKNSCEKWANKVEWSNISIEVVTVMRYSFLPLGGPRLEKVSYVV